SPAFLRKRHYNWKWQDCSFQYATGKVEGHHPVGHVDDLGNSQIAADRYQHIGVHRIHVVAGGEQLDHLGDGAFCPLHQIGANSCGDLIPFGIDVVGHWPRGREAGHLQWSVLDQVEGDDDIHLAFDRRATNLAVALRSVAVTYGEEGTFHLNRQVEDRAGGEIADVEVAANPARRNDRMVSLFRQGNANCSRERLQGNAAVCAESRRRKRILVVVPQRQGRLLEVISQEPEARYVRSPAETGRLELLDRDLQDVARLGAFHVNRAGDRIDLAEIEVLDALDRAFRSKLSAGGVLALKVDRGARNNTLGWREGIVPPQVRLMPVDRVIGGLAHRYLGPSFLP